MKRVFIHPLRRRALGLWHGARRSAQRCSEQAVEARLDADAHARRSTARSTGSPPPAGDEMLRQGVAPERITRRCARRMCKYEGTDAPLVVPYGDARRDRRGLRRGASAALRLRHAGQAR